MIPIRGRLAAIAAALLLVVAPIASAAPPTLGHLFPAGGQRGSKVVVTCSGKFDWPVKVFAPGVDVTAQSESGKLEVSIPADFPADRVWVRLYNAEGASANVPFLVGQLPEISEQEPNHLTRSAQRLADPNVTINGALASGDVDAFAASLKAGQTLVAALDAHTRLGSPMDAILQVATPEGFVLAENHDDLGLDPRLAFTANRDGTYVVRLFAFPAAPDTTIAFRGGDDYVYRLTLTTGPFITHAIPLSVPRSAPGTAVVAGWNVPAGTELPVVPFGGARLPDYQELEPLDELRRSPDARLGFIFSPGFAGGARVRLSPYPAVPRVATSDPKQPVALTLPGIATGRLETARQNDSYSIPLKKGQQLIVSVEARSFGLPLDPVLKLADPTGAAVAEVDDTGASPDAVLSHTAARDGDYQVTVGDRFDQAGERCLYLLTARLEEPDFELSVAADSLVVTAEKPLELAVKVVRRGMPGPITIEPAGLPPGVTAAAVVSEPTGPTAGEVKLAFTTAGQPFSGPLRIIGKVSEPKPLERLARTPAKLGVSHDQLWLTAVEKH